MITTARPTPLRLLLGRRLLLLFPFALTLAFLLSLTLDSIHLAGPYSLCLSLHSVDISLIFIALLSTLLFLLIPP